ncbi:MAG: COX15/CtaA family protein [Candidatus Marinamargulisbacteria bacterium]
MDHGVRRWLQICICLVAGIVIIGGATRLTGSGLSMVDWQPIMGTIPPLSESAWQATFSNYQQSPEFQIINYHMTLTEFKLIFFWEYLHRMFGRLIGLVAVIGWAYLMIQKRLTREFSWRWIGIMILIGCQGIMGWYMVKSGLVDTPSVSHFRLAAHLSLAFIIFSLMLREYLPLCIKSRPIKQQHVRLIKGLFSLIALQIIYGAFTAGLDAGHYYNTFPKMGGQWLPESAFMYGHWLSDLLRNPIMIQWVHRWLGLGVVIGALLVWQSSRTSPHRSYQYSAQCLLGAVLFQFILGVITLLTGVWLPVALAHQFGGLIIITAITSTDYFSRNVAT